MWIGRRNTPKLTYRVYAIPIKNPGGYVAEIDKLIHKFILKFEGPRIAKTTLMKKNKARGLPLLNIKTGYKATAIKTKWY